MMLWPFFHGVAGQVRSFGEGAALETARRPHQFCGRHVFAQRILARVADLALDRDHGRVDLCQIAVNDEAIFGCKRKVVLLSPESACPRFTLSTSSRLSLVRRNIWRESSRSVRGKASRKVNSIADARLRRW